MIFQATLDKVLSGEKTQTRRVVKSGEDIYPENRSWRGNGEYYTQPTEVYNFLTNRVKYQVGKTYAIQPGRGKKAVGRIRITAIRRENLQDITEEDARAEGIDEHYFDHAPNYKANLRPGWFYRAAYADLWDRLYEHFPEKQMGANPEVWVIEFERVA
jgi:hypothetical protein